MTNPGGGAEFRGKVNIEADFTAIRKAGQSAAELKKTLTELGAAVTGLKPKTEEFNKKLEAQLRVYTQASTAVSAYVKASSDLSTMQASGAKTGADFGKALKDIQGSLSNLTTMTDGEVKALRATLTLYNQVITISQKRANVTFQEAAAINKLADAELKLQRAKSGAQSAEAKAKASAMQEAAQKAKAANAAQKAQEEELRRLQQLATARATATSQVEKQAQAESRLAATAARGGQEKLAVLDREVARRAAVLAAIQREQEAARKVVATSSAKATGAGATPAQIQAAAVAQQNYNQITARATQATKDLSAAMTAQQAQVRALTTETDRYRTSAGGLNTNLASTRYALYEVSAAYAAVGAAAGKIISVPLQVATAYEDAFADVARTTQLAEEPLDHLRAQLVDLTSEIPKSFEELSGIASLGAQLGIPASAVAGFTEVVAKFAAVSDVSASTATTLFGRLQNLGNIQPTVENFRKLGSTVAELGVNSVATETEILNNSQAIAASTTAAKFSTEATIGYATALASLKVPPELARGAMQRTLFIIDKAMSEGGESAAAFAKTLGLTVEQAKKLHDTNPEGFYTDLVTGIGKVTEAGGDYVKLLDDLGIKNSRDIAVIQRLSGSYDLLKDSVQQAYDAYSKGTFLDESAEGRFKTLKNQFIEFQNSLKNLADAFGAPLLAPITKLVEFLKFVVNGFRELSDSPVGGFIAATVLAFVGLVAVFAIYKGALAAAAAGTLAFRQVQASTTALTGSQTLSLRNLSLMWRQNAAAQAISTGGSRANAAAVGTQTGVINAQTAALRANAAAAGTAAAANTGAAGAGVAAGAGTAAGGIIGGLKKAGNFAKSLPGIGIIASLGFGLASLAGGLSSSEKKAKDAAIQFTALKTELLGAGGGMASLKEAIATDTAEFDKSGKALSTVTTGLTTAADGTVTYNNILKTSSGALVNIGEGTKSVANEQLKLNEQVYSSLTGQQAASAALRATNKDLGAQTVALGDATVAWQQKALATFINGNDNFTPEQKQAVVENGATYQDLIRQGIEKGYPAVVAQLETQLTNLHNRRVELDQQFTRDFEALNKQRQSESAINAGVTENDPELVKLRELHAKGIAEVDDYITKQQAILDNFKPFGAIINDALISKQVESALGVIDPAMEDLSNTFTGTVDEVKSFQDALIDAAGQMDSFAESAFAIVNTNGEISSSMYDLGQSIIENGTSFDTFSESGRANMEALQGAVSAYADQLSLAVQNGTITAGDALSLMMDYIGQIKSNLESAGVDTGQLDFLNQYINNIVNAPRQITITADMDPALSVIAQGVNAANALLAGAALNPANTPTPTADPSASFDMGAYYARYEAQYAQQQEAAQAAAQASRDAQSQERDASREQKAADQEENAAAKEQQQAAKQKEQDLQNEIDYVKELAGYYSDLGTAALKTSTQQGSVFASLTELGTGLAKNGKEFNTFTEGGRANLASLEGVLNSYGDQLSNQVENAGLSASDASAKFKNFAGGVYSDLLKAGVPAKDLNAIMAGIGTGPNSFANQGNDVKQFGGFITAAMAAEMKYGTAAEEAAQKAADARQAVVDKLQQEKDYLQALGEYYGQMSNTVFSLSNAQGSTFESLQNLGASLVENGKRFNVVTAGGRANLNALQGALSSFGNVLKEKVTNGVLTAGQAAKQMSQYAGGLRAELIKMGVPAKDIDGYFKAIGYSADGFKGSAANVKQFAGTLTAAEKAARQAAVATAALATKLQIAADWAARLKATFSNNDSVRFGLTQARDAATTAGQALVNAYQSSIDKVNELRAANAKLKADLAVSGAAANKANIEFLISQKYGETDRAKDYAAQRDAAKADIKTTKDQIKANDKQAKTEEEGQGALKGNTAAAIQNRASIIGLLGTYQDQIAAYARTGASAKDVAIYAKKLQDEFKKVGAAAGFSANELAPFTAQFSGYVQTIRNIPQVVNTEVSADTSAAEAALNALPSTSTFTLVGDADLSVVKKRLFEIPDRKSFIVDADTKDVDATKRLLAQIPGGKTFTITSAVSSAQVAKEMAKIPSKKTTDVQGSVSAGTKGKIAAGINSGVSNGGKGYTVPAVPKKLTRAQIESMFNNINQAVLLAKSLSTIGLGVGANGISSPKITTNEVNSGRVNTVTGQKPVWTGGRITASGAIPMARGGLLGGRPPNNPRVDNIGPVLGPGGSSFTLRSREYIQPQPAVEKYGVGFMNALRTLRVPVWVTQAAMGRGMAGGGSVGGGGGGASSGGTSGGGSGFSGLLGAIVQLSPQDRSILMAAMDRPINLYTSNERIASSADVGGQRIAERGRY